ncbi:MAG: 2OG-Fe(II) oxygenase [Oceanospirillaceae bacterium]
MNLEFSETQLDNIADQLADQGYLVLTQTIEKKLLLSLKQRALSISKAQWREAGVGRAKQFQVDKQVRSDKIHWISPSDPIEKNFLALMDNLRHGLNRRLFMGLFDYESHFAIYQPGEFYQKHIDALKGRSNRVLSTVLYLNENWQETDAGELVLYPPKNSKPLKAQSALLKVAPQLGTMIIFLSEKFPHEVLAAQQTRYSIAGWFRVNNNHGGLIDPAR